MPLVPPAAVPQDQRTFNAWCRQTHLTEVLTGAGDPSGVVIANRGTIYLRTDGAASTTLYIKTSGDGLATGWTAK